ncbi:hypothetical protein M569_10420, partial [Genlisea aurea]
NFFLPALFSVLVLSLHFSLNGAQSCNPNDKKALLDIKASFGNPASLSSWNNSATNCCTWLGVTCDSSTKRVVGIELHDSPDFAGKAIPSTISELTFLQSLQIYNLNLVGSIPTSITALKNLNLINLAGNRLSGPIPQLLSQIQSLTYVSLGNNFFSGSIPPSLSNLKNLYFINFEYNNLTGTLPASLGNIGLTYLYLSHNQLSGAIPTDGNLQDFDSTAFFHNKCLCG